MEERDKLSKIQNEQRASGSEEYRKKLKDVRWQKMRLNVFERDKWLCRECGCGEMEGVSLNAHHTYYLKDKEPWDYPLESIVTLCETCHEAETHRRSQDEHELIKVLRKRGILAGDLRWLTESFQAADFVESPSSLTFAFGWILDHPNLQKLVLDLVNNQL